MAAINFPFSASGPRRAPTSGELLDGYPCGPLDVELDNFLMWWLSGQADELISKTGLTPDDAVLTQMFQAARLLGGESYTAAGTINALEVTPSVEFATLSQLSVAPIRVKAIGTNTAAATLKVGALAAKPIVRFDGSPLAEKDIILGDDLVLRFDVALDAFRLQSPRSVIGRGCLCTTTVASAYGSGTEGAIEFNTEVYDTDNIHSLASNITRMTVPAGVSVVVLGAQVAWEPNATGSRKWRVLQNGSIEGAGRPAARVPNAGPSDITTAAAIGWEIPVTGGDYFELLQVQDSGTALPIRTSGNTWFGMKIIR